MSRLDQAMSRQDHRTPFECAGDDAQAIVIIVEMEDARQARPFYLAW